MALRDKQASSAQQFLQPGETLQVTFGAQTASQWLILVGILPFLIVNRYRVIAVTDRRILVLDAGLWGMAKAKGVVGELPRAATLGPGNGLWHPIQLGPEKLRVHRRFFKDLAKADALSGATGVAG